MLENAIMTNQHTFLEQ